MDICSSSSNSNSSYFLYAYTYTRHVRLQVLNSTKETMQQRYYVSIAQLMRRVSTSSSISNCRLCACAGGRVSTGSVASPAERERCPIVRPSAVRTIPNNQPRFLHLSFYPFTYLYVCLSDCAIDNWIHAPLDCTNSERTNERSNQATSQQFFLKSPLHSRRAESSPIHHRRVWERLFFALLVSSRLRHSSSPFRHSPNKGKGLWNTRETSAAATATATTNGRTAMTSAWNYAIQNRRRFLLFSFLRILFH